MAIQIQGYSSIVAECDSVYYRSLRVTMRPLDYGALGQYRLNTWSNPVMAAGLAAGSDIYQARWTSTPQLAIIWGVQLDGFFASTAFVAGFGKFVLTIARNWSVDGGGGTAATLTDRKSVV